jgi:hypothetical protein
VEQTRDFDVLIIFIDGRSTSVSQFEAALVYKNVATVTFRPGTQHSRVFGFKMLFSFHAEPFVPRAVGDGLYNRSVDYYHSFQQHLHCNLEVECTDGRDESMECPFSNEVCKGKPASRYKCFFVIHNKAEYEHKPHEASTQEIQTQIQIQ